MEEMSFEEWEKRSSLEETETIIQEITVMTGIEIFGASAKNDDPYLVLYDQSGQRYPIRIPKGMRVTITEEGKAVYTIIDEIGFLTSFRNPMTKLRKYRETYGRLPQPGQKIKVRINPKGFPELIV
ncbi:MAG: hypothetical protein ACXQTD_07480 [Candidatus Syntropharchaeia archaeon]